MRDVKQTCMGAGVKVLFDDAGRILYRQFVIGKRHHPGAEAHMLFVERRALKCARSMLGNHRDPGSTDETFMRSERTG